MGPEDVIDYNESINWQDRDLHFWGFPVIGLSQFCCQPSLAVATEGRDVRCRVL
jgi:hypothetical protein